MADITKEKKRGILSTFLKNVRENPGNVAGILKNRAAARKAEKQVKQRSKDFSKRLIRHIPSTLMSLQDFNTIVKTVNSNVEKGDFRAARNVVRNNILKILRQTQNEPAHKRAGIVGLLERFNKEFAR